jgi:hypothetical protein
LKKTIRHQHLQNKELKKIVEFSGFFGKKFATWQPKKKPKNPTMDILGLFLQILPYFERNLLNVTIFKHSIHGGQQ